MEPIMQNNPIFALVQMAKNGGNPMPIIQQAAMKNPQINQLIQMMSGKTPQQLQQMAENIAKEKGTTVEAVAQQLGISVPSKKE